MLLKASAALALCHIFTLSTVQAAPTWPDSTDEIENLLYCQAGYRAPALASAVTPCSNEIQKGSNFFLAAAFLRTAFHDVAAHNELAGTGGLDASIGYEMQGDFLQHNNGPDFMATVKWAYSFFNSKASMADLIALNTYAAVRSCGGPSIAIRAGRIDATGPGANALPDVQDSQQTLADRFGTMGFTPSEMVQLVACGHTLGSIHTDVNSAFNPTDPNAITKVSKEVIFPMDTTQTKFDNLVASEYVDGTTQNQMVVSSNDKLNSDKRVFTVDNEVTIRYMAQSNDNFNGLCQVVLQKMLEKVPSGVQLSAIVQPYDVRPTIINLNVVDNGAALLFSGEIRIRTTSLSVSSVTLVYTGSNNACTGTSCNIQTTQVGTSNGFDESFTHFGFSAKVKTISSFNVVVVSGGLSQTFTNNGQGFQVNDNAFVQWSSSSLSGNQAKVVVAVRHAADGTPSVTLTQKSAYVFNTLPKLNKQTQACTPICSDNAWSYYQTTFTVPGSVGTAKLDVVVNGKNVDSFRSINFASSGTQPTCPGVTSSSSTTTASSTKSTLSSTVSSTISSSSSSSLTTTSLTTSSSSKTSSVSGSSSSTTSVTSSGTSSVTSSSSSKSASGTSSTSSVSSSSSSSVTSTTSSKSTGTSSVTSTTSGKSTSTSSVTSTSSGTSTGTSSSTSVSSSTSTSTTGSSSSKSASVTSSTSSGSSSTSTSISTSSATSQTTSASSTLTTTASSSASSSSSLTSSATSTDSTTSGVSATTTSQTIDGTLITTTTVSGSYTLTTTYTTTAYGGSNGGVWDPVTTTPATTASEWQDWYVTTVDAVTTYCPYPTTIVTNGHTYTVYKPTMLTITDCPCTITVSGKGKGSAQPTTSLVPTGQYAPPVIPDNYQNHASGALDELAQAYQQYGHQQAPNGGTDGGNKNIEGLVKVTVVIVTPTITGTKYYGPPTDTWNAWSTAATTFVSVTATGVNAAAGTGANNGVWSTYKATGVSYPSASNTKWAPIATYKGDAKQLMGRGEAVMAGAAAALGAIVMVL